MKYGVQHQSHEKSKCERCELKVRVESQLTVHLSVYARGTNGKIFLLRCETTEPEHHKSRLLTF